MSADPTRPAADASIRRAARGFEQSLLAMLVEELQQTATATGENGSEDGAAALGAYRSLLPEALAAALEGAGGLGIADDITRGVEARS